MTRLSRRQFLRGCAAAAGGVLAACGVEIRRRPATTTPYPTLMVTERPGTPIPTPEGTGVPAGESGTILRTATPTPTPRPIARDRTLVLMDGPIEHVSPGIYNPYAIGYTHREGQAALLEGLFYYVPLADKVYAHLAESYAYNDDATELTVYLRPDVTWSDGEPFTAADVAFTYARLIETAPTLAGSARIAALTQAVEAVDATTVRFTLTGTNPRYHFEACTFYLNHGVPLVPRHVFQHVPDWATYPFSPADNLDFPLVTGAYRLAEDTPTHRTYELRPDWWAAGMELVALPQVERVTNVGFAGADAATAAFAANDVDYAGDLPPRAIAALVDQVPHVATFTGREPPYGFIDPWPIALIPNTLTPPYDDPRVRWALAYAIDQQALVDVAWEGAGTGTAYPFPEYPALMRYAASLADVLAEHNPLDVDPARSAALMEDAGFTRDREGFWVRDGERPAAALWTVADFFGDLAPVVAEQLRAAGFDAAVVSPPDVWTGISDGRAPLHFFGHDGSVRYPYATLDLFHNRWQQPTGTFSGPNRPRWDHPAYSQIVTELAGVAPDDPAALDLFREAMTLWYAELPEIPLVQGYQRIPHNTTYWTGWPTAADPYNTALWHLTMPITLWTLQPA